MIRDSVHLGLKRIHLSSGLFTITSEIKDSVAPADGMGALSPEAERK